MELVLAVLVVGGGALLAATGFALAEILTRPAYKKPPGGEPDAVGLPFESLTFASHDGKRLVGWLVGPELEGPPVVVLHGYTDNKSSYLSHARFLYENGYPSFLYDQRGHGESQPARISLGPLEARDLLACLETLERLGRGHRFVVWGISMGAATALLAGARTHKIAGIVAESSYERLEQVVADTVRLKTYLPKFPLVTLGLAFASIRCGTNLLGIDVRRAVGDFGSRPLFLVSGALDPRMPPALGERLLVRARGPKRHLVVPGAAHAECWPLGQPEYGKGVIELIDQALDGHRARRK